jgi:sec-independent protein translocase protein TatA
MINLLASFLGPEQWIIVLVVILLLFGGTKIPELMRGVGRGVGELQKGLEEGKRTLQSSINEETKKKDEDNVVSSGSK